MSWHLLSEYGLGCGFVDSSNFSTMSMPTALIELSWSIVVAQALSPTLQ
jgi:hypothetical protein